MLTLKKSNLSTGTISQSSNKDACQLIYYFLVGKSELTKKSVNLFFMMCCAFPAAGRKR
jgi:hypothetical protein